MQTTLSVFYANSSIGLARLFTALAAAWGAATLSHAADTSAPAFSRSATHTQIMRASRLFQLGHPLASKAKPDARAVGTPVELPGRVAPANALHPGAGVVLVGPVIEEPPPPPKPYPAAVAPANALLPAAKFASPAGAE